MSREHRSHPVPRTTNVQFSRSLAEALYPREALEAAVTPWNNWTRLQPVQFEWENEPQLRHVHLVSTSPQVGDPMRMAAAGVEMEAHIEAVESSLLRMRVGRRLF